MHPVTNDRDQHRVVLIFGDPGQGKSYLANQLRTNYGYYLISLDGIYVEFVQTWYPDLYLPALNRVIAQHYRMMLVVGDRDNFAPGAVVAWRNHLASLVEATSHQHQLVVVEGYLLLPALDVVQERLADKAVVTTVEVRNRQYFVAWNMWSIEQIHQHNNAV